MTDDPYRTLSSRIVWKNPYYSIREDSVRYPNGSHGSYAVIQKPPAVYVVALVDEDNVVLIRNYRYPLRRWQWEIPAGAVQGDATLEETARAELLEEVGGQTSHLEFVGKFATMPGTGTEEAHVFIARDVVLGVPRLEPSEKMERHIVSIQRAMHMALHNEMADGLSSLALLLSLPHLPNFSSISGFFDF